MEALVSLSKYIDVMRKLTTLTPGIKDVAYFVATDDAEAEKIMRSSFEEGEDFTQTSELYVLSIFEDT